MKFIIISLLILFLLSCKEDQKTFDGFLSHAKDIVDTDPQKALIALDSISNPEEMEKSFYMQYILTYFKAKFETGQDISKDTLIFTARQYYENLYDVARLSNAEFYSGHLYLQKEMPHKALGHLLRAVSLTERSGDFILEGRCLNNIGYVYFQQEIMDSAILYYRRTLNLFENQTDFNQLKIRALTNIGRAYEETGDLNNAQVSFSKALLLSEQENNEYARAISMLNLGVVYSFMGNQGRAKENLYKALTLNISSVDSLKIYLSLFKLYSSINQIDSANHYRILVETGIKNMSDHYDLRYIYASFSKYYKQLGNYQEALHYTDLEKETDRKIMEKNRAKDLFEANRKLYLENKQNEIEKAQTRSHVYLVGGALIIFLITFFAILIVRGMRKTYLEGLDEIDIMKVQFRHKMENLLLLQTTYLDTMMDLMTVDKEARLLEGEKKEKAEVYRQTRNIVAETKHKTRLQLIKWAKDYLSVQPFMEKISLKLTDNDQLLLALCGYRYSGKEIAVIMGIPQDVMYLRKLELRNLFEISGLSDSQIDEILFLEDKSITM